MRLIGSTNDQTILWKAMIKDMITMNHCLKLTCIKGSDLKILMARSKESKPYRSQNNS